MHINKKAQVTMFIILGLVILIGGAVGLYAYYKSYDTTLEIFDEQDVVEGIQKEVKVYVDNCLKRASLEGLYLMGKQAGFANIPEQLQTVKHESYLVPMWLDASTSYIPTINQVLTLYENFIDVKMLQCLDQMKKDFKPQDVKFKIEEITTLVNLSDKVQVRLNVEIEADAPEAKYAFDKFYYEAPINFDKLYRLAWGLVKTELRDNYLEFYTENLVSVYSGLSTSALPPRYYFDINLGKAPLTWDVGRVNEMIKDMLEENMKLLRIRNTRPKDSYDNHKFSSYLLFDDDYTDVDVQFDYNRNWETEIDLEPTSGGQVRPATADASGIPQVSVIKMAEYSTRYSIIYPVLVTLTDTESAKILDDYIGFNEQEGYSMSFVMMTSYVFDYARVAKEEATVTIGDALEQYDMDDDFALELVYCDVYPLLNDTVPHRYQVIDIADETPIANISTYVKCNDAIMNCFQGYTSEYGYVTVEFPNCTSDMTVEFLKDKVLPYTKYVDLDNLSDEIYLSEPVELEVTAFKIIGKDVIESYKNTGTASGGRLPLTASDQLMITFENKASGQQEMVAYPNINKVKLTPGVTYTAKMMLISEVNIQSMKDPQSGDDLGGAFQGKYTLGNMEVDFAVPSKKDLTKIEITTVSTVDPLTVNEWPELGIVTYGENQTMIWNQTFNMPFEQYEPLITVEIR